MRRSASWMSWYSRQLSSAIGGAAGQVLGQAPASAPARRRADGPEREHQGAGARGRAVTSGNAVQPRRPSGAPAAHRRRRPSECARLGREATTRSSSCASSVRLERRPGARPGSRSQPATEAVAARARRAGLARQRRARAKSARNGTTQARGSPAGSCRRRASWPGRGWPRPGSVARRCASSAMARAACSFASATRSSACCFSSAFMRYSSTKHLHLGCAGSPARPA